MSHATHLLLIVFSLMLIALLFSCADKKSQTYKKSKVVMDTLVTITVTADSRDAAETAIGRAFAEIERLSGLIDFFSEKSELSAINRNAGTAPVNSSKETMDLIEKSLYVSNMSAGKFDATIGPVITQWDFKNPESQKVPASSLIMQKLNHVDYKKVIIDKERSTVYLRDKGMMIDLGGIAKGYAADIAVETLRKNGIKSGIVAVAGDIKAFGLKPDNKPWLIGIKNPRPKESGDEIMATINLTDMAISTSGDYERYFIKDGKRYHHLIDPKTGFPAEACQSVSVIAKDGVYTDAFSTAAFILGPDKGLELLQKMGFEGIIVDSAGQIHTTEGLRGKIEFKRTT